MDLGVKKILLIEQHNKKVQEANQAEMVAKAAMEDAVAIRGQLALIAELEGEKKEAEGRKDGSDDGSNTE